jgi:hypothetical protein
VRAAAGPLPGGRGSEPAGGGERDRFDAAFSDAHSRALRDDGRYEGFRRAFHGDSVERDDGIIAGRLNSLPRVRACVPFRFGLARRAG